MAAEARVERTGKLGALVWPPGIGRRALAEMLGTALLVLFGAGSVLAALAVGEGELTYAGLGFIALAFGLIVAIVIYALGQVSGAHINPAVTIALAAKRRFPWSEVAPYLIAQLIGAVVGALLIVAAFGTQAVDAGLGGTQLGEGVGTWQGLAAEALGTFLLMFAIMAMAVDARTPSAWAGWIIGLSVTCSILVIGPVTGSAINPARTFGPYLTTTLFGGDTPWAQMTVYTLGPLVGAVLAAFAYDLLARPGSAEEATDASA
jgi:glycerol uptake facilitator protein